MNMKLFESGSVCHNWVSMNTQGARYFIEHQHIILQFNPNPTRMFPFSWSFDMNFELESQSLIFEKKNQSLNTKISANLS